MDVQVEPAEVRGRSRGREAQVEVRPLIAVVQHGDHLQHGCPRGLAHVHGLKVIALREVQPAGSWRGTVDQTQDGDGYSHISLKSSILNNKETFMRSYSSTFLRFSN